MSRVRAWLTRWNGLFGRERQDRELDAELQSHIQMHTEDNLRAGMSPQAARRDAVLKLGGMEQIKESCRDLRTYPLVAGLVQDGRYALRQLRRSPGFAAVAVLTLVLGIGANTAIFSLVNGFLLRPLPVPSPDQLYVLAMEQYGSPLGGLGFSYPQFAEFREQARSFCDVFGQIIGYGVALSTDTWTDHVYVSTVTGNFFSGLGVKPAIGRLLLPGEGEHLGEEPVLVLSYAYWQRRFGGNPAVLGKQVRLYGKLATVVGVLPKEFHGSLSPFEFDAYMPLSTAAAVQDGRNRVFTDRSIHLLLVNTRLKPGISRRQAQSSVNVIAQRLAEQYPATDDGIRVQLVPERLSRPIPYANTPFLLISTLFLILAGLVLLLACTNLANLLLARALVRRHEMAIRSALGAGRLRLIRQMLTETILIASLGGAGGIILAQYVNRVAASVHLPNWPIRLDASMDWRVFVYAFAATVLTVVFTGLSPAFRATRADVNQAFRLDGRTGGGSPKVRSELIVVQIAGSLMLLIVAGLFVRGLWQAERMDLGFDSSQLLNVGLDTRENNYSQTQTEEFYRELKARIGALPGVQSASLAASVPIASPQLRRPVSIEGQPVSPHRQPPAVLFNAVDSDYFQTMRIPLLRGREFTRADREGAPPVAVINQEMANRYWPGQDPIGKRFRVENEGGEMLSVVGLSATVNTSPWRKIRSLFSMCPLPRTTPPCGFCRFAQRFRPNPSCVAQKRISMPSPHKL